MLPECSKHQVLIKSTELFVQKAAFLNFSICRGSGVLQCTRKGCLPGLLNFLLSLFFFKFVSNPWICQWHHLLIWRIVERRLFRRKWSTWEHEIKNWRTWAKSLNRTLLITFYFYCNLPLVGSLFYLLLEFSIIFFFRELQIFFSTEKVSLKVVVISMKW